MTRMVAAITAVAWGIGVICVTAVIRVPGKAIDIYFSDRYVVVSKVTLVAAAAILFALPALVLWRRRFRLR